MDRLAGKVCIVTGAASGIGRATALMFLQEGAKVLGADLDEAGGEALLAQAKTDGAGDRAAFRRCDVTNEGDVAALVAAAQEVFGGLDVMVNNAGISGSMASLETMSVEDWDFGQAVLLKSVFLGIKHGGAAMRKAGKGGAIVNTSSIAGIAGGTAGGVYSAAKAGVENLTRNAAVQLASVRVRVNCIAPGPVYTPITGAKSLEGMREYMKDIVPWPDIGQPEDIAHGAVFLASDEARYVTGSTLVMDGGCLAAGTKMFRPRK